MNKRVNCIMLVDDNPDDNFIHERIIKKNNAANIVIIKESAKEALEFLCNKKFHPDQHPDLIFLDINMPGMNGWEFVEEYEKLDKEMQGKLIVVMLTTSDNPDDKLRAKAHNGLADFKTKPLTKEMLDSILNAYFRN